MKSTANNIEDLLEILAGMHNADKFHTESADTTIMHSIARQTFKGTALTNRQYALMKEKLQTYRNQFEQYEYDFDSAIDNLRNPLRHIDRSKYITIVDYPSDLAWHNDDIGKFIKVRFPFKKTDIMLINEINDTTDYYHSKGSHEHYFSLTEKNLYNILSRFIDKQYTIDSELIELYNEIVSIKENPKNYLPYVENGQIKNIKPSVSKIIDEETDNDILKVYDRRFRYCLENINVELSDNSLEERIASRCDVTYHSKPSLEAAEQILYSLYNLDRFPMIVVLENHQCEEQLYETVNFFRDLIPSDKQSVLFRAEEKDSGFNQLIKDRKLNNWVDKDTKIVYISNTALPKVLLETDWSPNCAFTYNSNVNKNVEMYTKNKCDLIVYREEELSPFRRYSRFYG